MLIMSLKSPLQFSKMVLVFSGGLHLSNQAPRQTKFGKTLFQAFHILSGMDGRAFIGFQNVKKCILCKIHIL